MVSVLRCLLSPPHLLEPTEKGARGTVVPAVGWQGRASLTQSGIFLVRLLSFLKEPGEEGSAKKLSGLALLESRP